ncbi:TRAP transporter small permease [Brevibacterium atlanticum]|uniref:TRAP transporter small permease n=1 Tax=Brevibacterium atlanticum TaxID=2697563 RepID=UPI00141D86BA|nr:TRAP transporter small permease [Brevibacterium atlanticum]
MSSGDRQRPIDDQATTSPRRENRILGPIADGLVRVTAAMRIFSGLIIVAVMLITGYDVIMRYLFARPLEWSLPVSMLGLVIIVTFAIPNIAASRSHISMDLFYRKFSPRGQLLADIVTTAVTLLFSIVVGLTAAGAAGNFLVAGLQTSGSFNLPVWIDYAVLAIGLLVLALVVILLPWQSHSAATDANAQSSTHPTGSTNPTKGDADD